MTDSPLHATVTQRGIIITPDESVLILQRATDGAWELPGGRLDRGEDAVAGLRREIREETGLTPTVVAPVHTASWINDEGTGRFGVYYYCRGSRQSVSLSGEHDAAAWRPSKAVASRLSKTQLRAVQQSSRRHR